MVIGASNRVILLFGGIPGCAVGATFVAVEDFAEEVFDEDLELDDPNDPSYVSTTDDVTNAGIFAIFLSIVLFIGAGLARVATKTSLVMPAVVFALLIRVIVLDTTSVFAIAYYLSILLTLVCVILMAIAYWRLRRPAQTSAIITFG